MIGNIVKEVGIWQKQSSPWFQAVTAQTLITGNVFYNGPRAGLNFNDGFGTYSGDQHFSIEESSFSIGRIIEESSNCAGGGDVISENLVYPKNHEFALNVTDSLI